MYCPLIYKSLAVNTTGWIGHCCTQSKDVQISDWTAISNLNEWYKSESWLSSVRKDLENDIQHPACASCWKYENSNLGYSKRQRWSNNKVNISQDTNIDIEFVDLRLSNKCNLQCKMCYGGASDQIAKLANELHEQGIYNDLYNTAAVSTIADTRHLLNLVLEIPNLKILRFAGGEPFIMPEVEEFLFKLVERGKTNLDIEFITNCTSAKIKVLNLLEKFKHVELMCSIDGTASALEYQRYPARWNTIEKNFIAMYNTSCKVSLTPCLTHLNLLNMAEFISWSNQFPEARVSYNEVDYPTFLNFRFVPLEERKELINNFKNVNLKYSNINWTVFKDKLIYEYLEPTQQECNMLKHYSEDIWDYRCNVKYIQQYPYMKYMIEQADAKFTKN